MSPHIIHGISYQYYSWTEAGEDIFALAKQIRESGQKFDRLVALAKGGLAFSRSLVDYLDIPEVSSIQVEFYSGINKTDGFPVVTQSLPVKIRNERILLFDDLVDTGKTVELAKTYIQQHGAKKIALATLFMKPQSSVKPDFYVKKTTAWIIFPNEVRETIQEVSQMWTKKGDTVETVQKQLIQIGIPKDQVEYFLKEVSHD